ncbi:hypothetical protein SANT12839_071850 [Streptomyces antimycoticus]|uniref:Uncharacterized protein n=1 Tax=Streptomyces antimycoticus TaxID=68175 RepID=A0A4D4KKA4_9ACTN|nr:hypothetical protein SANT12839_071850 [Streptomyces antimycoticus]
MPGGLIPAGGGNGRGARPGTVGVGPVWTDDRGTGAGAVGVGPVWADDQGTGPGTVGVAPVWADGRGAGAGAVGVGPAVGAAAAGGPVPGAEGPEGRGVRAVRRACSSSVRAVARRQSSWAQASSAPRRSRSAAPSVADIAAWRSRSRRAAFRCSRSMPSRRVWSASRLPGPVSWAATEAR